MKTVLAIAIAMALTACVTNGTGSAGSDGGRVGQPRNQGDWGGARNSDDGRDDGINRW